MTHRRTFSVRLGDRGRLVLPSEVRAILEVEPGDRFTAVLEDDGSVRLVGARAAARRGRGLLRQRVPRTGSLVDELIAERRDEARRE
jgi:bifunctional DNA-binding transcriptional regulator/antitoxin component of YhaV-PrlF toxin-antitoxin module